jgi:hypothetical protein
MRNPERSAMTNDRRKNKRRYLLYYTRIYDTAARKQAGNLVDITTQGVMMLSPEPFEVGKQYRLRMELSDDVSDRPHMEIDVLTRWSHPDIDPRLYSSGFEIFNLGAEEEKIIQRIVSIYGFRDNILPRQ